MSAPEEIRHIGPNWAVWSAYEPEVRVELWSTAVHTPGGWLLVDPIPVAETALERLLDGGRVAAVAMTNGNHARACEAYRRRLSVPIAAHPLAAKAAEMDVDLWLDARATFTPGVRVVELPGGGPGEVALLCGDGLCVLGDILVNLASHPFQILPAKYCTDPREARLSLIALAKDTSWDSLSFAHGDPVPGGANERLRTLISETIPQP